MPKNFHLVTENIYRGGEPSLEDLRLLAEVYKIKKIVSLDGTIGNKISEAVESLGMKHVIIPLTGTETNVTDLIKNLAKNIHQIVGPESTYVHCLWGADRTGLAIGLYRVKKSGWKCEQAIQEAKKYQFGQRISPATQNVYKKVMCELNLADDQHYNLDRDMDQFLHEVNFIPNSYSVREDIDLDWPTEYVLRDHSELKKRMKEWEEIGNHIPQVGTRDNWKGISGAGPSEVGGFLQL